MSANWFSFWGTSSPDPLSGFRPGPNWGLPYPKPPALYPKWKFLAPPQKPTRHCLQRVSFRTWTPSHRNPHATVYNEFRSEGKALKLPFFKLQSRRKTSKMSTYSRPSFSSSTWKRGGAWMCKLGVTSQERFEGRG